MVKIMTRKLVWRVTILIIRYEQPLLVDCSNVDDKLIKGVTGHRSDAQGYKRETEEQLWKVSKIVQGQEEKESTVKGNSNSALTSALEFPSSSGTLVVKLMFVVEIVIL